MRRVAFIIVSMFLVLSVSVQADVGVFMGNGQNLRQVTSEKIQLLSIDVTIIPGRGHFLFDGSVSGMNRVKYHCNFELKNLTDKTAKVQVGFPVDSQFAKQPYPRNRKTAKEWVLQYAFIARDEKNTYHVDFTRQDMQKKFQAIFTWEMSFAPGETKNLTVQYTLTMSMTLAHTGKNHDYYKVPKWRWKHVVNGGILEYFGYVTETGSSWAGKVQKATFTVVTGPFEKYLDWRGMLEEGVDDLTEEVKKKMARRFPIQSPWWFRKIIPEGWKPVKISDVDAIRWEHTDFKPREPIAVRYYYTLLPRFAKDVDLFIDTFFNPKRYEMEGDPGEKISPVIFADLVSMKEIMLATYGKKPKDKIAREFAENQVWYNPKKDFSMMDLTAEQRAILKAFDRRIKDVK